MSDHAPSSQRRQPLYIEIRDQQVPDVDALLRGEVALRLLSRSDVLCPASGQRIAVTPEELAALADASRPLTAGLEQTLVAKGLRIGAAGANEAQAIAEAQVGLGWHPLAAAYHAATRWSGQCGEEGVRDHSDEAHAARLAAMVEANGPPPTPFYEHPGGAPAQRLPTPDTTSGLWDVFRQRRTCRHYRTDVALPAQALSDLLYGTFGMIGQTELAPGITAVKKTSASGGALHPVEAFPLVVKVEGLQPGLYHYRVRDHALSLLQPMGEDEARAAVSAHTIGQIYFAEAHAVVFHVARADRNHWKYRRHAKAYKVLFLDSGHLSQTFYLLAASMGLGAFYTAAINDADIDRQLGLDPRSQFVIGANGVGIPDTGRDALDFRFTPAEAAGFPADPGHQP